MVFMMESSDISEYFKTTDWSSRTIHSFDEELASKAEKCSSKWVNLYKNVSHDKDERNVCKAIRTTGLKSSVNKFSRPISSQITICDSMVQKDKIVLLDEKYFQFETSNQSVGRPLSNEEDDLNIFSTVFDNSESVADVADSNHKLDTRDEPKKPSATKTLKSEKNKKTNKKKGRTQYRPFVGNETDSVSTERTHSGAPPGVAVSNSQLSKKIDFSKGGNASIQFRL